MPPMLQIDLSGKRAFVAGVADDGGFGFAIAKALFEAGASICVGTWPPAMTIFTTMLRRGKFDESLKTTEDELRSLFSQYGEVSSVNVITDRETGRPRGFAFVEMEGADAAISALDQKEFGGRVLTVNEARPRRDDRGGGGGGGRRPQRW